MTPYQLKTVGRDGYGQARASSRSKWRSGRRQQAIVYCGRRGRRWSRLAGVGPQEAHAQAQIRWDQSADFVTIGAGVAGLAAAISALEHGASVIMVDENFDIGGHGMVSGGLVHLGGGHASRRRTASRIRPIRSSRTGCAPITRRAATAIAIWCAPSPTRTRRRSSCWSPTASTSREADPAPRWRRRCRGSSSRTEWHIKSEIITSAPNRKGSGLVRGWT